LFIDALFVHPLAQPTLCSIFALALARCKGSGLVASDPSPSGETGSLWSINTRRARKAPINFALAPVNQIRPREKEASTKRPAAAGDGTGHGQAAEPAISPSVKLHDTIATRLGAVKLPEGVTPEEIATLRFVDALHEDALRFMDMTEEDIQEEYRRAGKLHRYDPDKE
jgi:hypothetical protein